MFLSTILCGLGIGFSLLTPEPKLFLAFAFSACWWGDLLLLGSSRLLFLSGLSAFLLGHCAFVAHFIFHLELSSPRWGALFASLLFAHLVWRWLKSHLKGFLKKAVFTYIVIITFMLNFATTFALNGGGTLCALGVWMFAVSDLCVARERFIQSSLLNRAIGLPLYFLAVVLLIGALT